MKSKVFAMEIMTINDCSDLAKSMFDVADNGGVAYAACFFGEATLLLQALMQSSKTSIGGIDIANVEYKGYSKEYFISLDSDYILDVEPAYNTNLDRYLFFDCDKLFISGDSNSAIIQNFDHKKCIEVAFDLQHDDSSPLSDESLKKLDQDLSAILHALTEE